MERSLMELYPTQQPDAATFSDGTYVEKIKMGADFPDLAQLASYN